MSVNFSQKPVYIPQNESNFGAINVQDATPKEQMNMLSAMELPSNAKEFKTWLPYFSSAIGLSVLISKLTKMATTLNPFKNRNMTVEDTFNQSVLGKVASKIDNLTLPVFNKLKPAADNLKNIFDKYIPNYFKELFVNAKEKFGIGMQAKNSLAAGQARGFTMMTAQDVMSELTNPKKITSAQLQQLGIDKIINLFKMNKMDAKQAVAAISEQWTKSKLSVKDLQQVIKDPKFLTTYNISKSFLGLNTKSKFSKILQKLFMYNAEGAGGGVAGGMIIGVIMNSIFLASTIKRTWNAPWGDKFSTFMEGAMCDFCGGMLVNMVIAPRLAYKLLGLKNLDKTAGQLKRIKQLDTAIRNRQNVHKLISYISKTGDLSAFQNPETQQTIINLFKKYSSKGSVFKSVKSPMQFLNALNSQSPEQIFATMQAMKANSALHINNAIGKLGKLRAFKTQGFLKDLIHKPVNFIGKILNVGLETLPAKVEGKMLVNGQLKNITKFAVFRNKIGNFLKCAAGYWRFFLVTAIVAAPIMNMLAKISHTVFGKPKKCYYGEEAEGKGKKDDKNQNKELVDINTFADFTKVTGAIKAAQAAKQNPKPALVNNNVQNDFIKNAVASYKNKPYEKSTTSATYVPSIVPTRFYDPQILGAINQKLAKCDKLEKYADKEMLAVKDTKNLYN